MTPDYPVGFMCDMAAIQFRKKEIKMSYEWRNKATPPQLKHNMKVVYRKKDINILILFSAWQWETDNRIF